MASVEIWKRGQRFAELARDFALLFDAARGEGEPHAKRERAAGAAPLARQLEREAAAMRGLMETIAAAQPLPETAPPRGYWNREDES